MSIVPPFPHRPSTGGGLRSPQAYVIGCQAEGCTEELLVTDGAFMRTVAGRWLCKTHDH